MQETSIGRGYDEKVWICHQADWSGDARVTWWPLGGGHRDAKVPGDWLVRGDDRVFEMLPRAVAGMAIAAAARGHANYQAGLVLSRPTPERTFYEDVPDEELRPGFLFNTALVNTGHRTPKLYVPLGWVDGVGFRMWRPDAGRNVLVDVQAIPGRIDGMPPPMGQRARDPDAHKEFDVGRIGRIALPLAQAREFCRAISRVIETGEVASLNMETKL